MSYENEIERMLNEAEAFLEEVGIAKEVERFLQSDNVQVIYEEAFCEIMVEAKRQVELAPEERKKYAGAYVNDMLQDSRGWKEDLKKDGSESLKIRFHMVLKKIPEEILRSEEAASVMKEIIQQNTTFFEEVMTDIVQNLKKHVCIGLIDRIYQGYIPQDLPYEIAGLLRLMNDMGYKGSVIPPEAVQPELLEWLESEADVEIIEENDDDE